MKKTNLLLIIIFALSIGLRLYFAFQNPYFDYGEGYSNLGKIEYTANTGLPLVYNSLSYSGTKSIYLPLFHYILAIFTKFIPIVIVLKILPNIFASLIVFIVFALVKHITKNKNAALLASFASIFIPVYFIETVNTVSVNSLAIPLIFMCIYFLMNHEKHINHYIITLLALSLTSSSIILLVSGLFLYIILLKSVSLKENKSVFEIIIFTIFYSIWINILLYRTGFIQMGYSLIWKNIPTVLLSQYFSTFSIADAILKIGLLPFALGLFIVYKQIHGKRNKDIYFIISFCLSSLLLGWAKLINLGLGLSILGISLTILFGVFIARAFTYINNTKVSKYTFFIFTLITMIFIMTSIIPTFIFASKQNIPSKDIMDAMIWLREHKNEKVVLGTINEGFLITAIAKQKNVFDPNFISIKNPDQYLLDVKQIYTSQYQTDTIRLLEKYDIDYIIFSNNTKRKYNITEFKSYSKECFDIIYDKNVTIYQVHCRVVSN